MNRMISVLTALGGLLVFPLVDSAIKGTIVLLLAGSVCFLLRRDSAATRHFVLSTALGLLLVMPMLSLVLPAWRILPAWLHSNEPALAAAPSTFIPPTEALSPVKMTRPDSDLLPWPTDERPASQMVPLPGRPAIQDTEQDTKSRPADTEYQPVDTGLSLISWTTWLGGVWFAGCFLLTTRLVVASLMLRRSARRSVLVETVLGERQGVSPPCMSQMPDRRILADDVAGRHPRLAPCGSQGSEVQEVRMTVTRRADAQPLAEVQRLQAALVQAKTVLGVTRPVQLMLDPHRSIPVVWGLWKTRLQLPAEAINWGDEQLRSVLLHELAHVRRHDLFVLALTQMVCALYWFNPLVWLAAWRLHVERERACDDLVLASGVRASAYAEHLLNVATQLNSSRWTHACGLAMARNSSLHGRLTAVLSEKQNRRNVTSTLLAMSILVSAVVAVPVAMMGAADEPTEADVTANDTRNQKATQKKPLDEQDYRGMDEALLRRWQELGDSTDSIPEIRVAKLRSAIRRFIDEIETSQFSLTPKQISELTELQTRDVGKSEHTVRETQNLIRSVLAVHGEPIQMAFNESPWPGTPGNATELSQLAFGPPDSSGLRVALVCEKDEFILGDSARLDLRLWNTGDATITVGIGQQEPGLYPALELEAFNRDGQKIATKLGAKSQMLNDIRFSKSWQLRPGETADVYGYRVRIGSGTPREAEGYPQWYTTIEMPDVQHGGEVTLTGILPPLTSSALQPSPGNLKTESITIKAIAPEEVAIWTAQRPGRWPMPGGVTLDVKCEVFHGADVATSIVLTWPPDETGTTRAYTIFVASDAFGNREPWHVAWERNSSSFWAMEGNLGHRGPEQPKPNSVRRIDFADKLKITTTRWYHKPDEMPEGIRLAFEKVFEPLPLTPRSASEIDGSVQVEQSYDVRPIQELLHGTWSTTSGDVRVQLTFPEQDTEDILCAIKYGPGVPVVETKVGKIWVPASNSIRIWKRQSLVAGVDEQDVVAVLRRGPESSLLLDIPGTSRHPEFKKADGILLTRMLVPEANALQTDDAPNAKGDPDRSSKDWVNEPNIPAFALCTESLIWLHEQHLDWSEPVNGLRAALSIRPKATDGVAGKERRIFLIIQNVSDQPIRFCDTEIHETDTPAADVEGRKLYLNRSGEIMFGIQNAKSTKTDLVLPPRAMRLVDMFDNEQGNERGLKTGDLLAEGIVKDSNQALFAVLNIVHAPEGAWTGKLKTPATRGAFAAQGPMPTSKEGQILFRYCIDHARLNGDIPGGLISRLHDLVKEFIQLNSGDQYGDAYAKKMQPLLTRFEHKGDWKQEDAAKLFDDIAAVSTIPLERTMNAIRENTLQRGLPISASMSNLNWGETMPGGLRMAWMLEPQAEKYHRNSALKSRVILHNSGDKPVMFVTRSFHQPQHKAVTADGITAPIESTFWTTIGRPEPYRLHPGEYCEVSAPGIGIGPQNKELEDWSNIRAGSWILADEGDEIIFRPGEILLTGDHAENIDPDWWLKFVTERIRRETPLPADSKEREVILFRVISDLFGNSPTPEEAAGFLADTSPQAVENLAKVLSGRTWHTSVAGPISSGEIKFRVLSEDPEAATRPRIATNPGRYNLGEEIRFVVSRRPMGETLMNEADLVWYPPGQDNVPTKVSLPNGYDTWAAGWLPGTTVLWVSQAGLLRSYDFTNNAAVKETCYEGDQIATAPIPEALNAALRAALTAKENVQEQPRRPVGPPAAMMEDSQDDNAAVKEPKHEVPKILMEHWRRFARTDGRLPGACVGSLQTHLEEYSIAFPKLRPLVDRLDATRDWPQSEVIALLDEITDIAPSGMPLQARLNEYILSNTANLQLGQPLPPEFNDVVWGDALANGLRAAWLVDSEKKEFAFGSAITSKLLIQNSGPAPLKFLLPRFTLPERAKITGGELHPIPFARASEFKRVRLDPGHYVEVPGFDMTLQDSLDLTQATAEAAVIAKPGAELQLSYSVDLTTEILQQPDDLKDPDAIWLRTIANRVAEEAPLPSSAADRELLLRHVMADLFGEPPTAEEIATLVADTSSEALTRLVERLQKRQPPQTFVGELTTGAATVRMSANAIETTNVTAQEQVRKPKHDATASLISKWQRFARTDGRIPGAVLGTVRSKIEDFLKQYPKDNATPALTELLPSYDVSHDWEQVDVMTLLDKTADLHTAPLGWADLPLEFGDMQRVRSGSPLPESLSKVAWGAPAENGLRVAWVLEPPAESYALGTVLKSRVLIHNNGLRPISFLTETWHQNDQHQARDADGQEFKVESIWYSGVTPMSTFRLKPGDYIEILGHGIGIGAGEYREERSTGSVGAWIEATVDDEVHFTTRVRFDLKGWTRPDAPQDPVELRKVNIAGRVALEAPLPSSAADRKQLITRVTNEIFGEDPTDAEVNDFLNDASPEALTNLTVQLQKREYLPLFRGTLATGETIFKVLPVDPAAATKPRRAIAPGRYVLGDSVQLAVQQVTSVERFGAPEVRANNAKILFLSPDPKVESPHPPYEISLPDGFANYAILWTRNSGQLFVVEPGSVRMIDFTNPAGVTESRTKIDLAPEYRALIPEALQELTE